MNLKPERLVVDNLSGRLRITDLSRMRTILEMMIRAGALAAAVGLVAVPATATMRGNTYTSPAHEVTVVRPDAGWELREGIPIPAAVAAFVVGEGTAAAVLLHWRLAAGDNITDSEDFLVRRPALAQMIAEAAVGDAGEVIVTTAEFKPRENRIGFVINFENREFERGPLENFITGFIVRGADDRQHLIAVRCATTRGTLEAWQSQFDRFGSSLTYTGPMATPVYTSRPLSRYWWFAAGGAILAAMLFFGRRRNTEEEPVRFHAPRSQPDAVPSLPESIAPVNLDAVPSLPESMAPVNLDADPKDALNVPDMFHPSGSHLDAPDAPAAYPEIAGGATVPAVASPEAAETTLTHTGAGYWTCGCGRKNPDTDHFCCRCNSDRKSGS